MTTPNPVADRLLSEARRKTARQQGPALGKAALIVGVIALVVSPISILGWIGGAATLALGGAAARRPAAERQARIAIALGFLAIMVGLFFFTMNVAQH